LEKIMPDVVDSDGRKIATVGEAPRMESCDGCEYSSFPDEGKDTGECRANPPTPVLVPHQNAMGQVVPMVNAVFPPVTRECYCFTFEPKGDIVEH
jgi:hypothetical protein